MFVGSTTGMTDPLKIEYTGVPFILIGKQRYQCHQGKDMNQKKKEKYRTEKSQRLLRLHDHNFSKNRKLVQDTKKKGCPVIFSTKKILSFPEFKIPSNTRNNKDKASKFIKTFLNDLKEAKDKKTTMKQCKFEYIVTFPKTKHLYHHTGIVAGVTEPLDPRVNDFIKKLIRSGCRRVKELESRAADFVTDVLFEGASKPDRYVGRFFPERRKIRNLITYIKIENRFSKIDQENVENFVSTCQQAKIRFTPRSTTSVTEDHVKEEAERERH